MSAFVNVTTFRHHVLHHRKHVFGNWDSIQSNKFIEYPRHISIEFNGKYCFSESVTLAVKHILLLTQNKQYQLHRHNTTITAFHSNYSFWLWKTDSFTYLIFLKLMEILSLGLFKCFDIFSPCIFWFFFSNMDWWTILKKNSFIKSSVIDSIAFISKNKLHTLSCWSLLQKLPKNSNNAWIRADAIHQFQMYTQNVRRLF